MFMHPSPMTSAVVAFKQTVNKCTAAALYQRVGVAQLNQPVPEAASSKCAGAPTYLLQRNSCGRKRKEDKVKVRKDVLML